MKTVLALLYSLTGIGLSLVIAFFGYRLISQPLPEPGIMEVSTGEGALPITGTFFKNDARMNYSEIEQYFSELQQSGFDTIIVPALGAVTGKNADGSYNKIRDGAFNDISAANVLKLAKQYNLKVYWGLVWSSYPAISMDSGNPNDPSTDMGVLMAYSLEMRQRLQQLASADNIPWNDPSLAGYYLSQEIDADNTVYYNSSTPFFYKELSSRLKSLDPAKKILISPFSLDSDTYDKAKTAWSKIYSLTSIDVIALQDSLGVLNVTSYAKSAELFRGLHDAAAQFPGRQAWANIESFTDHYADSGYTDRLYNPASISQLTQQVSAAQPYVSKMITYVYEHTMMSLPGFESHGSVLGPRNPYTPEQYLRRQKLRNDYMSYYNFPSVCNFMYYFNTQTNACAQTSSKYSLASHGECGKVDVPTCEANLNTYLPGKTTGACHLSLAACQAALASPSPSPAAKPGDFNGDGQVDIFDYNLVVANFGNPYTIFDYNILVANFGT